MSQEFVLEIAQTTIYYTALLAAPILGTGLLVGLFVSMFQAVTQVKEMTLTFIPKFASVMIVLVIALPWMMNKFIEYVGYIMSIIQTLHN